MLFRPNFCANCGVKIERPEWYPWTSRRFCLVCEVEFKGHELLPKAAAVLILVFGLFGLSGLFGSSGRLEEIRSLKREEPQFPSFLAEKKVEPVAGSEPIDRPRIAVQPEQLGNSSTTGRNIVQGARSKHENETQISFCGAETKKGTPCSRRVKGNTRCFQHQGMPTMKLAERSVTGAQR